MEFLQDTHIWYLFSFLGFLVLATKFGKEAVLEKLDGRIAEIKKEIKTAESLRIEAQELLAQYQRKHRDALKDAEKIVDDAKESAKENTKQAKADLAQIIERREKQLDDRLERMQATAIQEIQAYAADLAMNAATEIITEQLDKKTSERLLQQSIKDVAKQIH